MTPVFANESEVYFERGGPTYRLLQRIGVIRGDDPSVRRRILIFFAITWIPLFLLCLVDGYAIGPTPRQSILLDFATYARFVIAVPLIFVAEVVVGPRLTSAGLRFVQAGFVRPEDHAAFDHAIARVVRWRESIWAELVILGVAVAAAWTLSPDVLYGDNAATWSAVSGESGIRLSLAGIWYKFIAFPIMQFLWYRWLWRLIIWTRFLAAVSRLNLDLVPTHADQAGGLGFLGSAHLSLGIFAVAVSSVLSADAAFRIVFDGARIETFRATYIGLLVGTELVCLGPLLVFGPILARRRRQAMREYGMLMVRYNRAFHEKWVLGKAPDSELLLGSADIQSLADLGGSFEFIRNMKLFPFSLRIMIQLGVVASLPALPLLPLVMPWEDILSLLAGALL